MGIDMLSPLRVRGRVEWVVDEMSRGEVVSRLRSGCENVVTDYTKSHIAAALVTPAALTPPRYIGLGDESGVVLSSDTTLGNVLPYNGADAAKAVSDVTQYNATTVRHIVQFTVAEGNGAIKQFGLYDAANDGNLWAKVGVTVNKVSGERLHHLLVHCSRIVGCQVASSLIKIPLSPSCLIQDAGTSSLLPNP